MATLEDKVAAQHDRFLRALPQLRTGHDGEWVVFLDTARFFAADERAALRWAHANLRMDAGYVVARVEEPEPVFLSAALAYRLAT